MALTFVDSTPANSRADGDTVGITVTHGFTLQDGDVLYAFLTRSDDLGSPWVLSGWTQVANSAQTTGNDRLSTCLRKVITSAAGEPSSYTFLTSAGAGTNPQAMVLTQVRGADTTTPEDATATVANGSNDFTPTPAAITVATTGALVFVAHFASMNDGVSGKTGGAPSGYTLADTSENVFAGQLGAVTEVAYKASVAAGTETPGAFTGTPDDATSEYSTFTVAVRPVVAVVLRPIPTVVNFSVPRSFSY